jgi:hypothetical protein
MVANLSRETHSEPLTVFVSGEGFNGPVYTSQVDSGLSVFAFVLPGAAFPRAGPATVQIIDDSDKVPATGALTASRPLRAAKNGNLTARTEPRGPRTMGSSCGGGPPEILSTGDARRAPTRSNRPSA